MPDKQTNSIVFAVAAVSNNNEKTVTVLEKLVKSEVITTDDERGRTERGRTERII